MSHLPLRKENNCLNCGTTVVGKYCHNCGQENIEPKESLWHLITHFFNDVTHFDGKFFSTLKDLLFRPGFLSKEYMNGRRSSYLNPIRMYLFTSFIFFLIFFSVYQIHEKQFENVKVTLNGKTLAEIDSLSPGQFAEFTKELNNGVPMTHNEFVHYKDSVTSIEGFLFDNGIFKNKKDYDSLLRKGVIKDNWFKRQFNYKKFALDKKYHNQQGRFWGDFSESLMHHFPQMLFVSLPFVALLLQLLYVRRKKFYYVSHAIFTIHLYIFVFIAMLVEIGLFQLEKVNGFGWLKYVNILLSVAILFYIYKAMRNFYEQGRLKTISKYLLFLFSFFVLIILLFVVFAFVSVFQV